jgi:hypothetical protein
MRLAVICLTSILQLQFVKLNSGTIGFTAGKSRVTVTKP